MFRSTPSRLRKVLVAGAAAVGLSGAFLATSITPASAACTTSYVSTNGNDASRDFRISSTSTCNDLNLRTATVAQNYKGQYQSGSSWINGSAGWKYRSPSTTTLAVIISNVANNTNVRVSGATTNAYAYAVH